MTKVVTLTVVGGFLALGVAQTMAQAVFVTNRVQSINVSLSGLAQDTANENGRTIHPVRITTRDLINDIGTATGQNFSGRARLLLVAPPEGGNGVLVVRDGAGRDVTDTDVSAFFSNQAVGEPVERSTTTDTGRTTGVQYSTQTYSFGSGGTMRSFTVQGYTITSLPSDGFTSTVNGTATVNGDNAVVKGVISASPARIERIRQ